MPSTASGISKSIPNPRRKPLQPKNFLVSLAGGGAAIIPEKPNPTIPHPTEECAGKENREISNFVEEIKLFRAEEDIEAVRQRTERLRSDSERALAAIREMDAEFERWMRESERRSRELAAADIEIRRIARAEERRTSCAKSLPFASLRAREDERRWQLAQLQEGFLQEGFLQEGFLQEGLLHDGLLQDGLLQKDILSDLSSVKSSVWLNCLKWTSNHRRWRRLKVLTAAKGDAEMEVATVAKVGCGGGWRWRWPKVGRGNSNGVRRRQCWMVPYCL